MMAKQAHPAHPPAVKRRDRRVRPITREEVLSVLKTIKGIAAMIDVCHKNMDDIADPVEFDGVLQAARGIEQLTRFINGLEKAIRKEKIKALARQ